MESLSELSTSALSSVSLVILKSIMSALLSYPYNIAIITLVSLVVAVQFMRGVFGSGNVKRDIKRMKGEIDAGKVKSGVNELKKDIDEISKEIEKLGLMLGNQAQPKNTKLNDSSNGSSQISQFLQKEQRKTDLQNSRFPDVKKSFQTVKNEFSALINN